MREELDKILNEHLKWIRKEGGCRANLRAWLHYFDMRTY